MDSFTILSSKILALGQLNIMGEKANISEVKKIINMADNKEDKQKLIELSRAFGINV